MAKLREKEPGTTLIFCRHGITDFPEDRFYFNAPQWKSEDEPALNPEGVMQADRLSKYLSGIDSISTLCVSPSLRTRQTAESIRQAQRAGVPVLKMPDLIERDMGCWEGRWAGEIQKQDPEAWSRFKTEPLTFSPSGAESLPAFRDRVCAAVEKILKEMAGQTVVVVTHVGTIRMAVTAALGFPLENSKRLVIAPASATRLCYTRRWPNLMLLGYQP